MKNKKSLVALILLAIGGIFGLTFAYFSNSTEIENRFETPEYGTTTVEQFVSPDNWQPGDKTEKKLKVQNTGEVDEVVRITYEEKWLSKNGDELPLTQNGNDAALIHWKNSRDWLKDGNTFYYKYKLAPGEETSELLDYVKFNKYITSDADCETTSENGQIIKSCITSGDGYDGATYTLKFTIDTVQYRSYQAAWNTNVEIAEVKPVIATDYLINNVTNTAAANYNDATADKSKLFVFNQPSTLNTSGTDEYRYIGNEPNNYVKFNCDDNGSNCESWRIVGIFSVKRQDPTDDEEILEEQRIKLVRDTALNSNMNWNNSSNNNDWTDENASLRIFLNDAYYNGTGDAASYGLKASARGMIDNANYYLGAISKINNESPYYGTTDQLYASERGNSLCGACGTDTGKLAWNGQVGLMYPSDMYMTYAKNVNNTCFTTPDACGQTDANTGWFYNGENNWLISPMLDNNFTSYASNLYGSLYDYYVNDGELNIRPVVYLIPDVTIYDGTGESDNPYVFKKL